jgi:hypothetical protein
MHVVKLEAILAMLQVGKRKTSWLCHLQHKSMSTFKEEWVVPDSDEASADKAYDLEQQRHCTPYSLLYSVNLQLFSKSIDLLHHWHVLQSFVQ